MIVVLWASGQLKLPYLHFAGQILVINAFDENSFARIARHGFTKFLGSRPTRLIEEDKITRPSAQTNGRVIE
jgi:hypothetical protein